MCSREEALAPGPKIAPEKKAFTSLRSAKSSKIPFATQKLEWGTWINQPNHTLKGDAFL